MKRLGKMVGNFTKVLAMAGALMCLATVMTLFAPSLKVQAAEDTAVTQEATQNDSVGSKAMAAAITMGVAALAGCVGMALAISKSVDGIARQPEADGKIRTTLMLGLVFIETVVIYALIVTILIVFVM